MNHRSVNLLHVEDDEVQQLLMGQYLKTIEGLSFTVTPVASEEAAVAAFQRGGIDFVLLDYQLESGNGLSCLRRVRLLDPFVPVVVISGTATPEVVGEFLRFGADDYLSKRDLNVEMLTHSVRTALRRADEWRQHAAADNGRQNQA